jgi:hypothetical protein
MQFFSQKSIMDFFNFFEIKLLSEFILLDHFTRELLSQLNVPFNKKKIFYFKTKFKFHRKM